MQQEMQGLNDSQAQLVETEALASQELADRMAKNAELRRDLSALEAEKERLEEECATYRSEMYDMEETLAAKTKELEGVYCQ
eukprot:scaffold10643_cov31-Prasinocladus_malaysianus.AAC.1